MDSFWDFLWVIIVTFGFVAYLILLFSIITDLFRDHTTSGWVKAIWIVFLFFVPLLTALVYLITRSKGMAERSMAAAQEAKQAQDSYIRSVAGKSSAEQIADAKALLDSGTITQAEYETLKAKALSS
ncbi:MULTISPECIES: SHOCT domain-containing protein [unclassified Rhodococcus (in: high G+C Gram-positive bacteria)]|uniref:SHOCT domain-containing protein n=1 Tax=unclassified Rhodococcus (in: high G+C Gram-positive bacteria) TaxID=192944 RepID=UPI001639C5F7|nr:MULTISPECIES: SHOCT domain-containing protein [unclassified Rhodococcus (in: high G+C Gram-positive bacteria)]MBC2641534.1 SHOCT domain-containing protein [Rhodococcus sp. 3A]MBC2893721.1 SHOCT domain-containing protein [Rhodococcus sp. 4CII]